MPELNQTHHIEYSFKREINELFLSVSLKNIALSLVAIFEPIFFYNYFNQSIYKVILYFVVIYFFFAVLVPFGAKVVSKIGIKHSILLSVPFVILYYLGMYQLVNYGFLLFILPLLNVVYKSLFWPAYHLDFAKFSEGPKRGRQLSIMRILNLGAGIISPFIGGYIIVQFGFHILFITATILLVLSVVPLFFSKEIYEKFDFHPGRSFLNLIKKHHIRSHLAILGWGMDAAVGAVIWSLLLYFIVKDYETIGGISSVATLIIVFFVYYIGILSDKYGAKKLLKFGALLTGLGWFFRGLITNVTQAFFSNSFYKFSFQVLSVSFNKEVYKRINYNAEKLGYIVYREVILNIGRIIILVIAGLSFLFIGSFLPAIIITSLMIFTMMFF